ncbi:hypothetical protein MFLO_13258 [Listeria floridensis FSL S10-1187]|uniref:Uncharacterized protein n=1 Tax=Listeria floridensis FSL S10-1187 TaxID=1265817 RepID=A0ABP3AWQ8_9LIST|nr:hypothetical protein MFLO_13258 [Listeria floridensis FSL S10-1187]
MMKQSRSKKGSDFWAYATDFAGNKAPNLKYIYAYSYNESLWPGVGGNQLTASPDYVANVQANFDTHYSYTDRFGISTTVTMHVQVK